MDLDALERQVHAEMNAAAGRADSRSATSASKPAQDSDKAEWKANRRLPTDAVIEIVRRAGLAEYSKVVGVWVWVEFPEKPSADARQVLRAAGFHWNKKRNAWQHPCGKFSKKAPYDPRDKYGAQEIEPASNGQTAMVGID